MLRAALLVVLLLVTLASARGRRGGGKKNQLKGDMKVVQERVMELGKEVKEIMENQAKELEEIQELTSQVEDLREEQENITRNQLANSDVSGSSEVTYTLWGAYACPRNSYTKTDYAGHGVADESECVPVDLAKPPSKSEGRKCVECTAKGFSTKGMFPNKQECSYGWTQVHKGILASDDGSQNTCVDNTYPNLHRRKKRFSFSHFFNTFRILGKKPSSTTTTPAPPPPPPPPPPPMPCVVCIK